MRTMQIRYINTLNNNISNASNKQWDISRKNSINKSKYKINYYPGCVMFKHACVFCSMSLLSVYMYVRMPLSSRFIAKVFSSRALPGFPITAHAPPVCVPDAIGATAVWWQTKKICIYIGLLSWCNWRTSFVAAKHTKKNTLPCTHIYPRCLVHTTQEHFHADIAHSVHTQPIPTVSIGLLKWKNQYVRQNQSLFKISFRFFR